MESKKIRVIGIESLVGHPRNPNRMDDMSFNKLCTHIKSSGNYEPIVVRPHRERTDCFEILNGHHRVKALTQLGVPNADCVVWDVDDNEALLLLATLNRLTGNDDVFKKSAIIKTLGESFTVKELAKILPDSAKSIEKLKGLGETKMPSQKETVAFLNPLTFFLSDEQIDIVNTAMAEAIDLKSNGTSAKKAADAIVKIAIQYSQEK